MPAPLQPLGSLAAGAAGALHTATTRERNDLAKGRSADLEIRIPPKGDQISFSTYTYLVLALTPTNNIELRGPYGDKALVQADGHFAVRGLEGKLESSSLNGGRTLVTLQRMQVNGHWHKLNFAFFLDDMGKSSDREMTKIRDFSLKQDWRAKASMPDPSYKPDEFRTSSPLKPAPDYSRYDRMRLVGKTLVVANGDKDFQRAVQVNPAGTPHLALGGGTMFGTPTQVWISSRLR